MKKVTALAGALLLSSSLVVGCTQSAAPNRAGTNYDTNNTGRVQDIGNRVGVRNIGPDARNLTNNATNNLRVDSSLEARVETIPGVKDAKVLVAGNTAYVAINQGTNLQGKTGTLTPNNATRDRYKNNAVGGTYGTTYGTSGLTGTYGTTSGTTGSVHPGTYTVRNNGVYGTPNGIAGYGHGGAGIMSGTAGGGTYALDTNRQGYGNYYNAGTQTYGTTGTAGNTVAPYGLNTTPGVTGRTGTTVGGAGTTHGITGKGTVTGKTFGTGAGMNGGMNRTRGGTGVGGVGTTLERDNVSSDVKARVTAAIKQANPAIQNVYVTANPALTNRMGAFVRDVGTGHPLRGGNDLLDTLRRMFPASR